MIQVAVNLHVVTCISMHCFVLWISIGERCCLLAICDAFFHERCQNLLLRSGEPLQFDFLNDAPSDELLSCYPPKSTVKM